MIQEFMDAVLEDPRITTSHIALYVALWRKAIEKGDINPGYALQVVVFRREMKQLCKISSGRTYFKVLQELSEFGYIEYEPSFSKNKGSRVRFKV